MPTYVDPNACNACQDEHQGPLCVYICPNDLMVLDEASNKGFNQEPGNVLGVLRLRQALPSRGSPCPRVCGLCPHGRGGPAPPHRGRIALGCPFPRWAYLRIYLPVPDQACGQRGPVQRVHRRQAKRSQEPILGRRHTMAGRRQIAYPQITAVV